MEGNDITQNRFSVFKRERMIAKTQNKYPIEILLLHIERTANLNHYFNLHVCPYLRAV